MEKTKLVELKLSLNPNTSIRVSAYPTSLPKRFIDLPKKIHELIQYTLPITQNMHASCKSMRTLYKTPISFLQDFYDATDIELKKETDPYATNSYRITFKVFENSVFEHHFNLPILSNEETLTLFKQEIDS